MADIKGRIKLAKPNMPEYHFLRAWIEHPDLNEREWYAVHELVEKFKGREDEVPLALTQRNIGTLVNGLTRKGYLQITTRIVPNWEIPVPGEFHGDQVYKLGFGLTD